MARIQLRHSAVHVKPTVSRREFCVAALAGLSGIGSVRAATTWRGLDLSWTGGIPPLFCTAYIDPTIPSQAGQEATVARYPIALVPQDSSRPFRHWRDRVRKINPGISLLAYQMVIEETTVPGPGHDRLAKVRNSWATYPFGYTPTVQPRPGIVRRIYDPRSVEWQDALVAACEVTMKSYPYSGLFLDQCTIFRSAAISAADRQEMLVALEHTLLRIRQTLPDTMIVGNSSFSFPSLNGELNENRPDDLAAERATDEHQFPRWNFLQILRSDVDANPSALTALAEVAFRHQCFFGATDTYQRVYWPRLFAEIADRYPR